MSLASWPVLGLVVTTPRLTLRTPTDNDFAGLLEAVDAGIHEPARMPFSFPWTDAEPGARRRSALQFWWNARASWSPDAWTLLLAVFADGRAIGLQEVSARQFPVLREVSTGSWLTQSAQGQGLGKEMRAGVLALAFVELGAVVARSGAFEDNIASLAVSRSLGYRQNGTTREAPRGEARTMVNFEITRDEWRLSVAPRFPVKVSGFAECKNMFGLDSV